MDFQTPEAPARRMMTPIMMMRAERPATTRQKPTPGEEELSDDNAAEDDSEEKKQRRGATASGRRVGGGGGVGCQAEKCTADLTEAKRYHRRHKVCEFHAKAPSVLVSGLRQRFCQQCSRFHELSEFDEAKRSCRRRLAGHNERRRKSTSEPQQGEGGGSSSSSSPSGKGAIGGNQQAPQCRPADHEGASRVPHHQMPYPAGNPAAYKHFQIR